MLATPLTLKERRAIEKAAKEKREAERKAKMQERLKFAQAKAAEIVKRIQAPLQLLDNCRPYEEHEIAHDFIKIRACYDCLRDGTATTEQYNRLSVAINLSVIRALELNPDHPVIAELKQAQQAMMNCRERYTKTGRFGFTRLEMDAIEYALDAHESLVLPSSPKQMERCMLVLRDTLNAQIAKRQPVTVPELIM